MVIIVIFARPVAIIVCVVIRAQSARSTVLVVVISIIGAVVVGRMGVRRGRPAVAVIVAAAVSSTVGG